MLYDEFVSSVQKTVMNHVFCAAGVILMGVGAYVQVGGIRQFSADKVHELCFVQPALF